MIHFHLANNRILIICALRCDCFRKATTTMQPFRRSQSDESAQEGALCRCTGQIYENVRNDQASDAVFCESKPCDSANSP